MPRLLALSAAGALSLVLAYLWRKRDEKARRKHDDEARRMRDGDALFTHLCAVTAPLNFGASTHTPRPARSKKQWSPCVHTRKKSRVHDHQN